MPSYEFECEECGNYEEHYFKIADMFPKDKAPPKLNCYRCKVGGLKRVIVSAPGSWVGGEGSDDQINRMRKDFRSHQRKQDDQVRHKHGEAYDDAIRGGAVDRIKKQLGDQ